MALTVCSSGKRAEPQEPQPLNGASMFSISNGTVSY
jgi:hypothetical protein